MFYLRLGLYLRNWISSIRLISVVLKDENASMERRTMRTGSFLGRLAFFHWFHVSFELVEGMDHPFTVFLHPENADRPGPGLKHNSIAGSSIKR